MKWYIFLKQNGGPKCSPASCLTIFLFQTPKTGQRLVCLRQSRPPEFIATHISRRRCLRPPTPPRRPPPRRPRSRPSSPRSSTTSSRTPSLPSGYPLHPSSPSSPPRLAAPRLISRSLAGGADLVRLPQRPPLRSVHAFHPLLPRLRPL